MKSNKIIYLPGLNGLRALAALSVLMSHVFQTDFGNWGLPTLKLPLFEDGVTLFFVISGFLITYLLLQELAKTNTVDVPKFYFRRILRIWPIYYLYILIVVLFFIYLGRSNELLNSRMYYYIFFAANIPFLTAMGLPFIVHYWSIGVEEQFYLFWPWLMRFFKNKLVLAVLCVLLIWLGLKYGSWLVFSNKSVIYKFFNVTRFHCMMVGALGAIFYYRRDAVFMKLFTGKWLQLLSWVVFFTSGFYFHYIPAVMRAEIIALFSLYLIMSQIEGKPKFINLEKPIFDFIGKISYGIYVIHPLLIYGISGLWVKMNFKFSSLIQYVCIYLLIIVVTVLFAWLSYKFYEKPFLKLKSRFAVVKSANSYKNKE